MPRTATDTAARPAAPRVHGRPTGRRDPRANDLSPAMRRAKAAAGEAAAPARHRHVSVPRLAPKSRLTSLAKPAEERRADFLALAAVRIGATAAEVAAGRAAGAAMRDRIAALRAAKAVPAPAGTLPFVAPRPARPARRQTRTAA